MISLPVSTNDEADANDISYSLFSDSLAIFIT